MNALEMHIDINLTLQKIASNIYRNLDPAEIDWLLNREVDRFIKDRIRPDKDSLGFDATEIDLDALRGVITNDAILQVYKKDVTDTSVFADFPGDYSFLIDDASRLVRSCDHNFASANKFSATTLYLYYFSLDQSTLENGPFYVNANVTLGGNSVYNEEDGPGLATAEELFTYRDRIMYNLYQLSNGAISFYWEQYGNLYKKNTIIAVATTAQSGSSSITIDGTTVNATAVTQTPLQPVITTLYQQVANRLIRGQSRSNVLGSAFAGTRPTTPVSGIDQYSLRVYHDKRFIVNSVLVSYVRKPRKISLSLDQSCELAAEFHSEIVDRTVLAIKEITGNPDWQVKLQDMMMNKA